VPPETDELYRRELESLARDLGVADRVTFAGHQSADSKNPEIFRRGLGKRFSVGCLSTRFVRCLLKFDDSLLKHFYLCIITVTKENYGDITSANRLPFRSGCAVKST